MPEYKSREEDDTSDSDGFTDPIEKVKGKYILSHDV